MVKLFNDTFDINEIIDSNSTEVLLESEFAITDNMPDIERIITTEGKTEINNVSVNTDSVTVNGKLIYNMLYYSNDEDYSIYSMSGEIPFSEEIEAPGVTEDMEAFSKALIDYIDVEQLTERSFLIKAVLILDTDTYLKRPVTYVSYLESDGSIQAKTKNVLFTDTLAEVSEEVNINDAVEVSRSSGEIATILKSESDVYITNIDTLNEKVLVEGICKVGFIYIEDNDNHVTGYVTEEFPFTHYLELKDSDDGLREINVTVKEMTYSTTENFDDEKKLIEFELPLKIDAALYSSTERNIITDCYSTDYQLELTSETINLSSLENLTNNIIKFEDSFEILTGTIRDIYSVEASPKISDKRIADDKYIIDGYLDVNMLYLNGEMNQIDKAFASLPFTADFPIDEEETSNQIHSDIKINKCNAYRKGSNSVNFNCDINVSLKFKNNNEVSVIKDIVERDPIDRNKMPSLVFRVVQPGESLWDIAKNYNLSINSLKELNEIPEDNLLTPGTKIIIARS
ncbi:MAG: DUF3794 domain-containing protein [Tissierellia bacterium]|nr:DUF3794 domain-containing protein [Tissierellia bacterium]